MTEATPWHWPSGYDPRSSPVATRNELRPHVTADRLWPVLVRAVDWPRWYSNAHHVHLRDGRHDLDAGVTFTWVTFGLRVTSTVRKFLPARRLAWDGRALGATGYHRWDLRPAPGGGCLVVTEEVQRGPAVRLLAPALRRGLLHHHQRWLEGLARTAEGAPT